MNDDPDIKEHKSFANEHSFDSCFKYETLIRFDFGQRMTHRDRRIIQAKGSVLTTPLMSVFLTK